MIYPLDSPIHCFNNQDQDVYDKIGKNKKFMKNLLKTTNKRLHWIITLCPDGKTWKQQG